MEDKCLFMLHDVRHIELDAMKNYDQFGSTWLGGAHHLRQPFSSWRHFMWE